MNTQRKRAYGALAGLLLSVNAWAAANVKPTVSLTAPTANQVFAAPANVTLSANAADSDGTISKVEFYRGTTLIATDTTAPYGVTWSNVAAGSYSLTAKAYDNKGASTSSTAVSVLVEKAPTVSLTAPANNASYPSPATITLTAAATDSDGSIAQVSFYSGSQLLGTDTTAPYSLSWSNVYAGQYSVTAVAVDNNGLGSSSGVVTITVTASGTQVMYLLPDQLGTPRLATDEAGRTVWRNAPTAEPFGAGTVEEDPDGDGNRFELNLRFPGQYQDQETGLAYNTFRDYDPATGRYVQSDPIGLGGGQWSTYAYVGGSPVNNSDPFGLASGTGAAIGEVIGGALGGWAGSNIGAGLGTVAGEAVDPAGGGIPGAVIGSLAGGKAGRQAGKAAGAAIGSAVENLLCSDKKPCPPCRLADGTTVTPGTIAYRYDVVPPSQPHWPFAGSHVHLYKANQNPNNCQCFWREIDIKDPPPPAGAIPIQPFQ